MKETPENPDDASDPLLAALRERLGNYSAPPPPGAWTGIRQRLPAAAQPWWRRSRPLLLLLVLLLMVGLTGVLVSRQKSFFAEPAAPTARQTTTVAPSRTPPPNALTLLRKKSATPPPAASRSLGAGPALPSAHMTPTAPPTLQDAKGVALAPTGTSEPAKTNRPMPAGGGTSIKSRSVADPVATAGRTKSLATNGVPVPTAAVVAQRRARRLLSARPTKAGRVSSGRAFGKAATAKVGTAASLAKVKSYPASAAHRYRATRHLRQKQLASLGQSQRHRRPWPTKALSTNTLNHKAKRRTVREQATFNDFTASPTALSAVDSLATRPSPLASLPPRSSGLVLPATMLPATVAARPDSSRPAPPVRRWALLALASPTLSYRTIGPRPATTTGYPDFAHLERPAAGLGAQVQVRRVLSGRWALAAGLGYQQYATRLALQLSDSAGSPHLNQRDTYRLLTLPVQFSYALGAPRGRLAKALLVGTEVGWYQGGRSTEGSDCGCQQQAYSASSNPYRPWNLALSLGLDLRYRVGSPASRWQWVVQPTGRYVLTSLAGDNTLLFSTRRPFSMGLLTGFSWDIR